MNVSVSNFKCGSPHVIPHAMQPFKREAPHSPNPHILQSGMERQSISVDAKTEYDKEAQFQQN